MHNAGYTDGGLLLDTDACVYISALCFFVFVTFAI